VTNHFLFHRRGKIPEGFHIFRTGIVPDGGSEVFLTIFVLTNGFRHSRVKFSQEILEIKMKQTIKHALSLFMLFTVAACAPQTAPPPTVDTIGTIAMQLASQMLTETVAAYSPTPPPATETPVPPPTETVVPTSAATSIPQVIAQVSPCYTGPGSTYPLSSNISGTKKVEIVGVGSVEGWYIIKNPYFGSNCWISAEHLELDPNSDFSNLPVISP
jgi:hypothetical protein